jgi:hypothetical protein
MIKARHVRLVVSIMVAAVVILSGCVLMGSVVIQSSLLLGTFSVGNILGSFGSMGSVLLVSIEGSLVFLMIMGGARVVLSQKLVRIVSYPKFATSPKVASRRVRVGGNYRVARRVAVSPIHTSSKGVVRAPPRTIRASP